MKTLLLRRQIERHRKAAEEAKGKDYARYCQERQKMLNAQAELWQRTRGQ